MDNPNVMRNADVPPIRIRATKVSSSSIPVWFLVPPTFPELRALLCSSLHANPNSSLLLQGADFTNTDVLRDSDLIEVQEDPQDNCTDPWELEEWISLNVGGRLFTTTKLTLTSTEPSSILAKMFARDARGNAAWSARKDSTGAVLIDRCGELFGALLNYLRTGRLTLVESQNAQTMYAEAEYYNFEKLLWELRHHVNSRDRKVVELGSCGGKSTTLTRADVIRALMVTPSNQELRFQGMDFEGSDLSKLDLRFINFKMSNLRGANLSYANLSYANFDRADLSDAVLDHAVMFGVKMPCASMERCSMQKVDADDPAGMRANFEGVNLRNAKLDYSELNGANFRVANLKFASMKHCELKQASFPGANMEQCDLSGSDLFEANLRGANLVDTNFGHLTNALHMSQTI